MKKLCVLILCLALLLTTGTALADVIKLGGLAPLTGTYSEYGVGFEVGFAMALEVKSPSSAMISSSSANCVASVVEVTVSPSES